MKNRPFSIRIVIALVVLATISLGTLWVQNLLIPLNGAHQWRQSDTLITAYYYCTEDSRFAYPRVAARDGTDGVAIGEFPVFSYLSGMTCRALGGWSEAAPKILNLLFLMSAFFFWGRFLTLRFGRADNDSLWWLVAFLFLPLHLNYLTIPMPEATALSFFGLAAWLWQLSIKHRRTSLDIAASIVFVLAFMIRPYHIWLLFVTAPSWARSGQVLIACVAGFLGWYRWWAAQVTTLPGYFGIGFESPSKILLAIPPMIKAIPERIFDQTAWLGLIPLAWGARRAPLWGLGFLASWGSMMVLKPTHIPAHAYYLMNAGFFSSVLIYLGLRSTKPKIAAWLAGLFIFVSVTNVQHNFQRSSRWPTIAAIVDAASKTPPETRVVSFMGPSPQWHYLTKRQGTRLSPDDFHGPSSCPTGMDAFIAQGPDGIPQFGTCEKTP